MRKSAANVNGINMEKNWQEKVIFESWKAKSYIHNSRKLNWWRQRHHWLKISALAYVIFTKNFLKEWLQIRFGKGIVFKKHRFTKFHSKSFDKCESEITEKYLKLHLKVCPIGTSTEHDSFTKEFNKHFWKFEILFY